MIPPPIDRYPGIRAFEQYESALFFGRSTETRELYQLIKVARLSVLFAKSGIGKSSLLNAGVIPLLINDVYRVFKVRFQDTLLPPAELLRRAVRGYAEQARLATLADERLAALRQITQRPPTLWEELRAYNFEKELGIEPIFIFDQFEEFFLHSQASQKEVIDCLADIAYERVPADLIAAETHEKPQTTGLLGSFLQTQQNKTQDPLEWWRRPLNFKIVFAIRSDRLSLLDNLSVYMPTVLNNRYQLLPLARKQVDEAIRQPALLQGAQFATPIFTYQDQAVEDIYDALKSEDDKGEVESFQLQIVCEYIEQQVKKKKPQTPISIGSEYFTHEGDTRKGINRIINAYYHRSIAALPAADQQTARLLIEDALIMGGVRISLPEAALRDKYRISEALLASIVETRIIRAEVTHLGKAYEIAHDTLVTPIVEAKEQREAQERAAQQAEEQRLAQLAAQKEKEDLEREAREAKEKAEKEEKLRKRANRIAWVAVIMSILAIVAVFRTYFALNKASQAEKDATKALGDLKAETEKANKAQAEKEAAAKLHQQNQLNLIRERYEEALKIGFAGLNSDPKQSLAVARAGILAIAPYADSIDNRGTQVKKLEQLALQQIAVLEKYDALMLNGQNAADKQQWEQAYSQLKNAAAVPVDAERRQTAIDKMKIAETQLAIQFNTLYDKSISLRDNQADCKYQMLQAQRALQICKLIGKDQFAGKPEALDKIVQNCNR